MHLNDKCALVIGASSGIGANLARRLARDGYRVAAVARRESELSALAQEINQRAGKEVAFFFPHDVTDYDAVPDLLDKVFETLGGLTHVYYAAGILRTFNAEEYSFAKDREMVEINLMGMIAWLDSVAPLFMRLKQGVIVGIGSVAGDRGRKGNPGYNTSKGAQAIYLEALRNRLDAFNVRVITIKPGFIETPMTAGMGNLPFMITADEAARLILKAAETSRGTVYVPLRWKFIMWIICSIPSFIFRKLEI
jgi:NAD(P)-dependent dehydrogenase (short-subunit alcohol dehydrogenase family)